MKDFLKLYSFMESQTELNHELYNEMNLAEHSDILTMMRISGKVEAYSEAMMFLVKMDWSRTVELESTIRSMRREIKHSFNKSKSDDVKRMYLDSAVRHATDMIGDDEDD